MMGAKPRTEAGRVGVGAGRFDGRFMVEVFIFAAGLGGWLLRRTGLGFWDWRQGKMYVQ